MLYTCEFLNGFAERHRTEGIKARFPADAAVSFCEALSDLRAVNFDDGQITAVKVTAPHSGQSVVCNVTAKVRTKVVRTFDAMKTV